LHPLPGNPSAYEYGVLPPRFFQKLQQAIFDRLSKKRIAIVKRS
jgi:hypothetical protein